MLEFKKLELQDKAWVAPIMREANELACEYCFGNLYMWSSVYKNSIARYGNLFLARDGGERPMYLFPCGNGSKKAAVEELMRCAANDGVPLKMYSLTPKKVRELETLFPGQFDYFPMREYFDYIYLSQDLIMLAGRKYHAKRNHLSYFKKTFQWQYEPLSEKNMDECLSMNDSWEEKNLEKNPEEIGNERIAITRGLDKFFELGFTGGVLRVDGRVVAYTFGEPLSDKVFCTHVEKAFADMRGGYPAINQMFAENALSSYKLINREEDTGSEGLRKAKESYYPAVLLPKYRAVYKG